MADHAKITSLDALESFRASLIIFLAKSNRALDQVADEVKRTRYWLQNEKRLEWEAQLKRRQKLFDQANQELISARFSEFKNSLAVQQMAVRKAGALVQEAEQLDALLTKYRSGDRPAPTVATRRAAAA